MRTPPHAQLLEIAHNQRWPGSSRIWPPFIAAESLFAQDGFRLPALKRSELQRGLSSRLQPTATSAQRVAVELSVVLPPLPDLHHRRFRPVHRIPRPPPERLIKIWHVR